MLYIRTPIKLNASQYTILKKAFNEDNKTVLDNKWELTDLENEKIMANKEINKYNNKTNIKD